MAPFRIIHISDLHFVENPFARGGMRAGRTLGAKSHSPDLASLLGDTLRGLGPVDVLAVTGDLTTDGSDGAFSAVRAYLEDQRIVGKEDRRQTYPITGLNMSAERTLAVPGNHDRFSGRAFPSQRDSFRFEDLFAADTEYPKVRTFLPASASDPTVAFFLMNSVPMPDLREEFAFWRRPQLVAGGYMPKRASSAFLARSREVDDEHGPDVVKIVLLHHHPVKPPPPEKLRLRDRAKRLLPTEWLKEMEGSDTFVDDCHRAGIHLVLFGHKHRRFPRATQMDDPPEGRRIVHHLCCPSTLQYEKDKEQGFYKIVIDGRAITVTTFVYQRKRNAFLPLSSIESIPLSDVG